MSDSKSLNGGTKMHPLSKHALAELKNLSKQPEPTNGINPGVVDRLERGGLAVVVQLPSPFKSHKGRNCAHLQITQAGRDVLESGHE